MQQTKIGNLMIILNPSIDCPLEFRMKSLWLLICLFCLCFIPLIFSASLTNKFGGKVSPLNSLCPPTFQQKCQCGKHFRNLTSTRMIAGKTYDTLVPLGDGLDGKVEHAFSQSLGRCVAIKTCTEDPTRLSKCTRELNVLQRMHEVAPHIVRLEDFEIKSGQPCTEGAVMSDFIRTVLIGTEKRKKRQNVDKKASANDENANNGNGTIGNSCNEVVLVEEMGSDEVEQFLRETKRKGAEKATEGKGALSLEQIKAMIRKAMDELHGHGIAHRDMHKDNAMLFPLAPLVNHSKQCEAEQRQQSESSAQMTVKVIDMGWACCFDAQKCGPLVSAAVPECAAEKALDDDDFSLQDVFKELEEL